MKGVCKKPEKVLDAPYVRDDFYINIMDWNTNGMLGVALDYVAYLKTAE